MKYVIFDLDNCLSDDGWRIEKIDWTKTNPAERYAAYHDACSSDTARNVGVFSIYAQDYKPLFFTARPESVREDTRQWIEHELGINCPSISMRGNNDHRSSVDLKRHMLQEFVAMGGAKEDIHLAFDDHAGVLKMYEEEGVAAHRLMIHDRCAYTPPQTNAGDVLAAMAATFRERSGTYKDNYKMVPKLCEILFPDGVPPEILFTPQWHLFELKLVKLSRFAISGLQHLDSIHDDAVYSAMIEACLLNQEKKQ